MSRPNSLKRPVIYLHAKGRERARTEDVEALRGLGCDVCSRLGVAGTVRTDHGYDRPVALLRELAARFPGRPVAFLRAGLAPDADLLSVLGETVERSGVPLAATVLSDADTALNPFAGLTPTDRAADFRPENLVALLAPGYLHRLEHWADHFALLSPLAVERVAQADPGDTLMQALSAAGGRLVVRDDLFLADKGRGLFASRALQPWESMNPPPFGDLSARLQAWLDAGIGDSPIPLDTSETATLHITHNWGGGIAHWIETFIESDPGRPHLQLRAEGPLSDFGCGQRLSLYAGNELRCPVASWWLQPPIRSVEDHVAAYRDILQALCRRYRVGRVIVSSLIGHSLDVLRTGLPTLQVLHDHFPSWPLLSVHPGPYLRDGRPVDIESALADHARTMEFNDKDAAGWRAIRSAWLDALSQAQVAVVAPGRSVLEMQARLEPAFADLEAHVVPHGCAVGETRRRIRPRAREDGRLRMVVLGRIQPGKGQELLREAMERLCAEVQVYLVGSGKSGERFFGMKGVNVIVEYEQDELPSLLEFIGPDFAALLSIVPETFSYTLSELQALGIPVVATRVGSFPDRIVHGETGWLVDARAGSLVEQVAALSRSPDEIARVRANLDAVDIPGIAAMRSEYERILPPAAAPRPFEPAEPGTDRVQFAAASYQRVVSEQAREADEQRIDALRVELDERTDWALDVQRQLKREHELRRDVERGLASVRAALADLQQHHRKTVAELQRRHRQSIAEHEARYRELFEQHQRVLASTSWKITRPFRFVGRVARNIVVSHAWNPLRWPALFANLHRNFATGGVSGVLRGLQYGSATVAKPDNKAPARSEAAPAPRPSPEAAPVAFIDPEAPASFPRHEQPVASIVIPVYNKWPYTAACLRSLAQTDAGRSFEVIVVDDGSSDETEARLSRIEGLTYTRNGQNLGFVGSCNRGAGLARGEYLVMLNNDTEVEEGWLDALIGTLEREEGAGLVGARLVYPNGRLQEAGGIIFSDGSGWNYGRDDDPEKPAYTYLREADYCSGACIALRRELFERLGGFDERYAPAYYEDTDLAFRVREAGLKVLVQPAATVIHHEGATSGTDLSTGVKQYQRINQAKFVERWRDELPAQPEDVPDKRDHAALRTASQHRVKGRVLFVGSSIEGAAEGPLYGLMDCCRSLGFGVTLIDLESGAGGGATELRRAGIEVVGEPWLDALEDYLRDNGAAFERIFVSRGRGNAETLDLVRRYGGEGRVFFGAENLFTAGCDRLARLLQARNGPAD